MGATHMAIARHGHHLRLSPTEMSAGAARRFTRRTLEEHGRPEAVDDVALVVSELVTNAVAAMSRRVRAEQDAAAPAVAVTAGVTRDGVEYLPCEAASAGVLWIMLSLYVRRDKVLIEVWDRSEVRPTLRAVGEDSERGRGLLIVSQVASVWGTRFPASGGKVVWCEVAC